MQSFEVPTINLIVEGKRIKCIADTGADPSLVVSEQLGREILGCKYRTQAEVNNVILPSEIRHVSNCAGGNVEIIGQAKVRVKFLKLTINTPMLILAAASKRMEPLIGVYGLKQLGVRFYTPDKIDLLGSPVSTEERDQLQEVNEAVELPRTKYTQINLVIVMAKGVISRIWPK